MLSCRDSALSLSQFSKRLFIANAFTLAVAEIHPAPPARMFFNRKLSDPQKTRKFGIFISLNAAVCFQSPELSLIPAMLSGYSVANRFTKSVESGTCEMGGM